MHVYLLGNWPNPSLVIGSSHSMRTLSPEVRNARLLNQKSAFSPCQCLRLAQMWMALPGSELTESSLFAYTSLSQ